jgi:hypothetical protein
MFVINLLLAAGNDKPSVKKEIVDGKEVTTETKRSSWFFFLWW